MTYGTDTDRAALEALDTSWMLREASAAAGAAPLVWAAEAWWLVEVRRPPLDRHYVRPAPDDPGTLIYTQSVEKGRRDIQTRIRAGRYLGKYFPGLTEAFRAHMAAWQTADGTASGFKDERRYPLAFADAPDDIVQVYREGPYSCMSEGEVAKCVRVYGAGDLAVAYLVDARADGRKVVARALVWPARKVVGRVYPTPHHWRRDGFGSHEDSESCAEALALRLRAEGYAEDGPVHGHTGFDGARLLRLSSTGRVVDADARVVVMPYLDGDYRFREADPGEDPAYLRLTTDDCSPRGDSTSGVYRFEDVYDDDYDYDDDEDDRSVCGRCGGRIDDGGGDYGGTEVYRGYRGHVDVWCEHCADGCGFVCHGSDITYADDVSQVVIDGVTYAEEWADDHGAYLGEREPGGEAWFFEADHPSVCLVDGATMRRETWLAAGGFECAVRGEAYDARGRHWLALDGGYPVGCDASADDVRAYIEAHRADPPAGTGPILDPAQIDMVY